MTEKTHKSEVRHFPLFVDLARKKILVIGGGKVAARRVASLSKYSKCITMVAPKLSKDAQKLVREKKCIYIEDCATRKKLKTQRYGKTDLLIIATNHKKLNRKLSLWGRKRNILVNVASDPALCDFYFPALVQQEEITVGICGDGKNHRKVATVRKQIQQML